MRAGIAVSVLLLLAASGAPAQILDVQTIPKKNASCPSPESGLTPLVASWTRPADSKSSARNREGLSTAIFAPDRRIRLTLVKSAEIVFAHAPGETMPKEYVYSGMLAFDAPQDGTYRVHTSEGMWIDIVQNGALVKSVKFGGGPQCTTISKQVDFPLKKGNAVLQLHGAPYETVDLLLVKLP